MKKSLKTKKLLSKKKKIVPKKVAKGVVKKVVPKKIVKVSAKENIHSKVAPKAKTKPAVVKTKIQKVQKPEHKFVAPHVPVISTATRGQTIFGPVNVKPYQMGKHEEYMNKKQLEHFRNVLLQWKSRLMAEVDRTMHHMQDEVANYPDPVDRASQEEEFSLELRARDRERKLLRKIEETLSRIDDNDYGYCDDCGAEIGVRRLEARPTATQCIECKTISEIREKQIGESS